MLFGAADESYIELKCISPSTGVGDAWVRLRADVDKIETLQAANNQLVCTALLATHGMFPAQDVQGHAATLRWCWAGNKTALVLDYHTRALTTLANVATGLPGRLFIVAVSV